MEKKFMVQIMTETCKRQMFTDSFEIATRAYDRIMTVARNASKLPERFSISVSTTCGERFTYHFAEAHNGRWMVDKKNWDWEDWFNW